MTNFAETIKACREYRNLTQKQLARLSGVPDSSITRIERGINTPRADTFEDLLNAMGFELVIREKKNDNSRKDSRNGKGTR